MSDDQTPTPDAEPDEASVDAPEPEETPEAPVDAPDDEPAGQQPIDEMPTLLRSEGATLDEVPDNTPTPSVTVPVDDDDDVEAPAGLTYVIHPKNGARCLVDEASVPELEVTGYKRA